MASVEKVGTSWRVRWREGGRGSPLLSSPRFSSLDKAEEYQRQLAARLEARKAPDGLPLTGRQLAERWRIWLAKAGRTPRYVEMAADRVIASLGDDPLSSLSRDALRALPLGKRRVVQAALRWGADELGAAIPAPCLKLPIGSPPRRVRPDLMPDDVFAAIQAAADAVGPSMGAIVHLVGSYGHRPESLSKLTRADVEADPPRLSLTVKGGDRIRHPIAPETLARLQSAPLPFLDPRTGKPFPDGWSIAVVYRSCLGRSRWKPEPGIYALKRRAISHMLGRGLDAATVASITGHRRPDTLLRHYARTNETRQEAALAAIFPAQSGDAGARREHGAQTEANGSMRAGNKRAKKQTKANA